jgi:hypothetical protein
MTENNKSKSEIEMLNLAYWFYKKMKGTKNDDDDDDYIEMNRVETYEIISKMLVKKYKLLEEYKQSSKELEILYVLEVHFKNGNYRKFLEVLNKISLETRSKIDDVLLKYSIMLGQNSN